MIPIGIASFGGVGLEVRLETSGTGTVTIADTGSGPQIAVALLVSTRIANALTGNVAGIWVERPYEGTTNVSLAMTGILFAPNGLYASGDTTDWDIGIDLGDTCVIGIDIDDCTTGINMADATITGDSICLDASGVINAATTISFEIAGTEVLGLASGGITTPFIITSTTDPQLKVAYDAQEYVTLGVSSAGVVLLKTYAAGVDTFEIEADGTITLDAGTDIALTAAGADIVLGLTGETVDVYSYIGANDFRIAYDTDSFVDMTVSSASVFEIATEESGAIILDAAGNITLESSAVTSNAPITVTYATADEKFRLAEDGSNYATWEVAGDGFLTITTVGTDADFEIATGTTGAITLDSTLGIAFEALADITFNYALVGTIANSSMIGV